MKEKILRIIKPLGLLFAGLFLGWLFFGSHENDEHDHSGHELEEVTSENEEVVWTCSMHPQIRQPEFGDCALCGMDLIPVDANSSSDDPAVLEMSESAIQLANIQTEILEYSKPEKEIYLNGKVEIDERNIHNQIAHYSGRIEKLYINFTGQKVTRGQKLARIYSPELVTAQKELFEAIKLKESMPKLYSSAIEKMKLWKLTDKQIKAIEEKGKIQEEIDILSDASGYVTNRKISSGTQVKRGEILFEIANLNNVWVLFDVYENDIRWIRNNDVIDFTVSSLANKKFSAKIKYIDPIMNEKERTIKVRAELKNTKGLLKPEMFVKGQLKSILPIEEETIIIPKSSVMWTGKRSIVYIKMEDTEIPSFEMREVALGDELGEYYIVEEGLDEDEEIVVYGTFKIDASAQLAGKYSSMNQPKKTKAPKIPDNKKNTPDAFRAQLNDLLIEYIKLSDALVASDAKKAKASISAMQDKFDNIDANLLTNIGKDYWKKQSDIIKKELRSIGSTDDIVKQRKAYTELSNSLIRSAKSFGTEDVFYLVYCSMANDDEGGSWLSLKNEVWNPYWGDEMLHCGDVLEKIKNK